jgi:hypothetical protein
LSVILVGWVPFQRFVGFLSFFFIKVVGGVKWLVRSSIMAVGAR